MKQQERYPMFCPLLNLTIRAQENNQPLTFPGSFRIGRSDACEVIIDNEYVSRIHAEVLFEKGSWWIRDLNSSNGLYLDGHRFERAPIMQPITVRLGIKGPEIFFEPQAQQKTEPPAPATVQEPPRIDLFPARSISADCASPPERMPDQQSSVPSGTVLRQYVNHYFKSTSNAPAGEHTMYIRRAFQTVQKKQKRVYGRLIAVVVLLALAAGGYALYERRQLTRQRALAEDIFYSTKSLELDIATLEKAVAASGNQQAAQIAERDSSRRRVLQSTYDQYLASLHVYDRNMTEQRRIMLRVARIFGECELDMPRDFEAEVNKYIKYWQHSDRLARAIHLAQQNGYAETISRELLAQGLPPQFFYLALQESNFDSYVSGPITRKGIAKGMWQFVPETAIKYGLHVGPLADLRRPDPSDERDQYQKATKAAARYLKDLYTTDAQASGFLVMACYNWGEDQILPLVRSMPFNPRERNFWRLLAQHRDRIPQETYDYVFYIVSAAVIGENPRLFGFNFDNPLSSLETPETKRATIR